MKKTIAILFSLLLISLAGCGKTDKSAEQQTPKVSEPASAVDQVGNDLNDASATDTDLSDEGLQGIDSGFSDIENI